MRAALGEEGAYRRGMGRFGRGQRYVDRGAAARSRRHGGVVGCRRRRRWDCGRGSERLARTVWVRAGLARIDKMASGGKCLGSRHHFTVLKNSKIIFVSIKKYKSKSGHSPSISGM
jgi:hypothetical protein